jgi:hypothetical protein
MMLGQEVSTSRNSIMKFCHEQWSAHSDEYSNVTFLRGVHESNKIPKSLGRGDTQRSLTTIGNTAILPAALRLASRFLSLFRLTF